MPSKLQDNEQINIICDIPVKVETNGTDISVIYWTKDTGLQTDASVSYH